MQSCTDERLLNIITEVLETLNSLDPPGKCEGIRESEGSHLNIRFLPRLSYQSLYSSEVKPKYESAYSENFDPFF